MANNIHQNSAVKLRRQRELFQQFDYQGDGRIDILELGNCLRVLGANPSERSIRQFIDQLRMCHIKRATFDEVMAIYERIKPISNSMEASAIADQLIYGFRFFDEHNTGFIPAARLARVLSICGEHLTKDEINKLLENRINEEGLVNYVELIHAITTPHHFWAD